MSEELEQISAPEATPETTTQESTPVETSPSQPVTSLDEAKRVLATQKSKPSAPQKPTAGPTTDYEKQYKEIQSLVGKQSQELGQLRKFYQENQSVIESYKQFLNQQQENELLQKYQSDPTAVIKELARREAAQHIAPYQEQMSQAQASNINTSIKEQLGKDYDTYAPVMAEMLDGFLEMDASQGSTYATELAQNPHILMQLAAGKIALTQKAQSTQQAQIAQQTKAKNLQVAGGVGKGNNTASAPVGDFSSLPVDDMRAQLKKMGIVK